MHDHTCTTAIVHACTMATVHACTMAILHVSCPSVLIILAVGSGGSQGVWGVWGAAGPPMISAGRAGLEFTSRLNCSTSGLQFKLGIPGYENICTSGLRFPGHVPVTIHWLGYHSDDPPIE